MGQYLDCQLHYLSLTFGVWLNSSRRANHCERVHGEVTRVTDAEDGGGSAALFAANIIASALIHFRQG